MHAFKLVNQHSGHGISVTKIEALERKKYKRKT